MTLSPLKAELWKLGSIFDQLDYIMINIIS